MGSRGRLRPGPLSHADFTRPPPTPSGLSFGGVPRRLTGTAFESALYLFSSETRLFPGRFRNAQEDEVAKCPSAEAKFDSVYCTLGFGGMFYLKLLLQYTTLLG